jgi:hypothetical protein
MRSRESGDPRRRPRVPVTRRKATWISHVHDRWPRTRCDPCDAGSFERVLPVAIVTHLLGVNLPSECVLWPTFPRRGRHGGSSVRRATDGPYRPGVAGPVPVELHAARALADP